MATTHTPKFPPAKVQAYADTNGVPPGRGQDRVRLTITVTPEVHAAFSRLSKASSMPIGRAMGEWLGDTLEAVEFTALKVEEARSAPRLVMQEVHAYAMGLADESTAVLQALREKGQRARKAEPSRAAPPPPRPVIRGGKSPGKTRRGQRGSP